MRNIYFESAGAVLSSHKNLFQYPPEDYNFIIRDDKFGSSAHNLLNSKLYKYGLAKLPLHIIKPYIESFTQKRPANCFLTFAWNHLIFRDEYWVIQVEWPEMLAGFSYSCYRTFKNLIERKLSSDNCKAIFTWSKVAQESFYNNFDSRNFSDKINLLPLAVPPKEFIPNRNNNFTTFIFVCSPMRSREDYNFHMKGGKETIEAFNEVHRKYPETKLIMISEVPAEYRGYDNIQILGNTLTLNEVYEQYKKSDIFLFPGHDTPFGVILEAMSFGLPVITTDVYGNKELVTDGFNGCVIGRSRYTKYFRGTLATRPLTGPNEVSSDVLTLDYDVVEALVDKMKFLIENKTERGKMGANAKYTVDKGEHSIANRNTILKKIFDGIV